MNANFIELKSYMQQHIVGQSKLIDRLIIGILCGGHLLIEGLPGLAKTRSVQSLANGLDLDFQRIQFTPDLIPGDITGSDIFVPQDGQFRYLEGPLFNDIILADEINRAPPKVQSALLEAMQENQITVGGITRPLSPLFMVIATQNPIEHEGTYPLPEAQLDRFFMKINIDYPNTDDELAILKMDQQHLQSKKDEKTSKTKSDSSLLSAKLILEARDQVSAIYMDEMLERYIVTLVSATRNPGQWDNELAETLKRGASPRATLALAQAARAHAFLSQRDFVEPGDIVETAADILRHRIALSFMAHGNSLNSDAIIKRILECVPIP